MVANGLTTAAEGSADASLARAAAAGRNRGKDSQDPEQWRLFVPQLNDAGANYERLRAAARPGGVTAVGALTEVARSTLGAGLVQTRTRVAALVLRDLAAMGWQLRADATWIWVRPGIAEEADSKEAIRRQLEFGRDDQLREQAISRFIMALERPTRFSSARPVTDLIADGRRLARQLEPIASLPRPERAARLAGVCQPYLQLVDAEVRDEHSGIRLMDIWRYFRHTWATRYRSTPGRNLFYLIRDAVQPHHPIMGITALGNAVMQLSCRDDALGWSREGISAALTRGEATDAEVLTALRSRIAEDIGQIYLDDLPIPKDWSQGLPDEVLDRLLIVEQQSVSARQEVLKEANEDVGTPRVNDVSSIDLVNFAKSPMFRAKRARATRELLRADRALTAAHTYADLAATKEGEWAIGAAIRQLKKRFAATAMMEITVCGAVAPYNRLLGGKLACLMMASPQVQRDYATRYDEGYSIIASQMGPKPTLVTPSARKSIRPNRVNWLRAPVHAAEWVSRVGVLRCD